MTDTLTTHEAEIIAAGHELERTYEFGELESNGAGQHKHEET